MKNRWLLLFVLVALALPGIAQKKSGYPYPIGVQAYTFRKQFPKDPIATLDMIQRMGITELEGGPTAGMSPEKFKALCQARGISIPATGCSFEQLEKDPQAVVRQAKALGATYVMCAWIPHKRANFNLEDANRAIQVFNTAGKILAEQGLTFCYHNHGYEFLPYQNGTLFDYLIQQTNPAHVSFEMDILWTLHGGGNPEALLKKYGKRFKLMHLKDLKKGITGDLTGHTPAENDVVLGTGQANFPAIFKAAKKAGIRHYFIEDESNFEEINVPKSIAFLKSL